MTVPGFDYTKRPEGRFEIPVAERLAAHRAERRGKGNQAGLANRMNRAGTGKPSTGRPRPPEARQGGSVALPAPTVVGGWEGHRRRRRR